jgi:fumarate hydratase class I
MAKSPPPFHYQPPFPLDHDRTEYRLLTDEFVETVAFQGESVLKVAPQALTYLAQEATREIAFKLRTEHLEQVAAILTDSEATDNDRTIALTLLRNAEVAAHGVLPFCQDTGTAIIMGKKGQRVWTWGRRCCSAFGRCLQYVHARKPALFANGTTVDVRRAKQWL